MKKTSAQSIKKIFRALQEFRGHKNFVGEENFKEITELLRRKLCLN
jgi:hypothetical protein